MYIVSMTANRSKKELTRMECYINLILDIGNLRFASFVEPRIRVIAKEEDVWKLK